MSIRAKAAVPVAHEGFRKIPENDPLRESRQAKESANPSNHWATQTTPKPPFRESCMKPPLKRPNSDYRSREFLTPTEIESLIKGASSVGRHRHRDSTIILISYRHGLRVSELISMRWDQVDLSQGLYHVRRSKKGTPSNHPLHGPEIRALRRLKRDYPNSTYVFTGERKGPLTDSTVRKMVARAGITAGIDFPIHPHMLRHSTGYKLANDGQDTRAIQHYLGHRNITHTVKYTELSPDRFKDFWKD